MEGSDYVFQDSCLHICIAVGFGALTRGVCPTGKPSRKTAGTDGGPDCEAELEKAAPNKGGHREKAMELTKQAQSQTEQGIQYYNQHPPQAKNTLPKPKK
jgi:hypothetical protein